MRDQAEHPPPDLKDSRMAEDKPTDNEIAAAVAAIEECAVLLRPVFKAVAEGVRTLAATFTEALAAEADDFEQVS